MAVLTAAPWCLRGPDDEYIKRLTYDENEYSVPAVMDGMLVLDIGAHIGTFARLCNERGAWVVAFEPDTENFKLLVENTLNQNEDRGFRVTRAMNRAVTDHDGVTSLYHCTSPSGHSCAALRDRGDRIEVPCVSIDSAIEFAAGLLPKGRIDLCKIDAEGAEYEMIESGCDFALVDRLDIEFHGQHLADAQPRAEKCRERLAALGFVEDRWEAAHSEHGWHRLYRGVRKA